MNIVSTVTRFNSTNRCVSDLCLFPSYHDVTSYYHDEHSWHPESRVQICESKTHRNQTCPSDCNLVWLATLELFNLHSSRSRPIGRDRDDLKLANDHWSPCVIFQDKTSVELGCKSLYRFHIGSQNGRRSSYQVLRRSKASAQFHGHKLELLSVYWAWLMALLRELSQKNTWSDLYFWYMVNKQTDIGWIAVRSESEAT